MAEKPRTGTGDSECKSWSYSDWPGRNLANRGRNAKNEFGKHKLK